MNYVLLFPDELRAESLGCYGHPVVKTPNIDALAKEGVLFEQNYTAHPVCGPSRSCIASGWYPHVDGKRTFYLPVETDPNMFVPLREGGFTTAHAGKDDMFTNPAMGKVFTEFLPFHRRDVVKEKNLKAISEARYSMLYPPVADEDADELGDTKTTRDAIDFIQRHANDDKPFFLMVSWAFPHPPYTCPNHYYNMYDPETMPISRDITWNDDKPDLYNVIRKYREDDLYDPKVYKKINAVYHGMISYVDMLVGQIVQALKDQNIYDDTTIIFCSDHGDFAGDARLLEKWPSDMTDMITRVPLIIRRPGGAKNHRINTPTQSIDILPTILDYEHISLNYQQFGVSLKSQIEGADGDAERAAYTEGGYDTHEPWCFEPTCFKGTYLERPQIEGTDYYPKCMQQQDVPDSVCRVLMQRYKNWKLIVRTNGQNELYDMEQDPLEKYNLYGKETYKDIQNQLSQKMLNWMIHSADVVPIDAAYRGGKR